MQALVATGTTYYCALDSCWDFFPLPSTPPLGARLVKRLTHCHWQGQEKSLALDAAGMIQVLTPCRQVPLVATPAASFCR